jgi:hypothetical protein
MGGSEAIRKSRDNGRRSRLSVSQSGDGIEDAEDGFECDLSFAIVSGQGNLVGDE